MNKKIFTGIAYVSLLIIIWGTLGSLIDFPLLQSEVYEPGSVGQLTTFSITGLFFTIAGIKFYPVILNKLDAIKNK
tara:strand:- start:2 stop:229 length:228 start_codon:yes stop_codon:yes gene_type:complete